MKIQRKYRCGDCGHRFSRIFTVGGMDETMQDPPCPKCHHQPAVQPIRIAAPAIVGTKSRAIDEAWRIAQEDHGMTDMRSGMKEGDTAYIPPPDPKPETITRPAVLWGGAAPSGTMQMPGQANLLSQGRGAAALAKAEGKSPMQLLHQGRPRLQAVPLNRG